MTLTTCPTFGPVYVSLCQRDTCEVLRDFISRETWSRLDLSLEDMGGVDGLVGRRAAGPSSPVALALLRACRASRRREQRQRRSSRSGPVDLDAGSGNPFAAVMAAAVGGVGKSEGEDDEGGEDDAGDAKESDAEDFSYQPLTSVERVITTSSLNGFTKYIGEYIRMMEQIPLMAPVAATGLFRLFDFYVLSVCRVFATPVALSALTGEHPTDDLSGPAWDYPALRQAVFRAGGVYGASGGGAAEVAGGRSMSSSVSLDDSLSDSEELFGLPQRSHATESVRFLLEMCQAVRARVMRALPAAHREKCRRQYAIAAAVSAELRGFVYGDVMRRLLPVPESVDALKGLKWDPRDLPETFNPYVTVLVTRAQGILARVEQSAVPDHLRAPMWGYVVRQTMRGLLEALAQIKKCTHNGRAQMSLDLATLQRGFDKSVSGSANCQTAEALNLFIKAYYYDSADDFCGWLQSSPEDCHGLALRHVLALVGCEKSPLSKLKRKARAALRQRTEEIWRSIVAQRLAKVEVAPPPPPPPRPNA